MPTEANLQSMLIDEMWRTASVSGRPHFLRQPFFDIRTQPTTGRMSLRKGSLLDPSKNGGAVYTDDAQDVGRRHSLIQTRESLNFRGRCRWPRLLWRLRTRWRIKEQC